MTGLDPDEISAALDLDAFVPAMKLDLEALFVINLEVFASDMSKVSKIYAFALTLLIAVFVVIGDPRLAL